MTVGELGTRMGSREFAMWQEFFKAERPGVASSAPPNALTLLDRLKEG